MYLYQALPGMHSSGRIFAILSLHTQNSWDLFDEEPIDETGGTSHISAPLHHLLNAHFDLRNHRAFEEH